jgi:hypothetical protein
MTSDLFDKMRKEQPEPRQPPSAFGDFYAQYKLQRPEKVRRELVRTFFITPEQSFQIKMNLKALNDAVVVKDGRTFVKPKIITREENFDKKEKNH